MAKDINNVAIVVQSRLNSERVPQKMIKPFGGSTLLDILLTKLTSSSVIPRSNIFLSVYESELKNIGNKYGVNIFPRSKESANEESKLQTILEWHDQLPSNYKYYVSFSGTAPLLKQRTMEEFYTQFVTSETEGLYGVFEKKTYFWDHEGNSINNTSRNECMNTKYKNVTYEAGHCMSGSRLDLISSGKMVSKDFPDVVVPFIFDEIESWDIDYPWQFDVGEMIYNTIYK